MEQPLVLFVHGIGRSGADFAQHEFYFRSKGYLTFAPTLPMYASATPAGLTYNYSSLAQQVYAWLSAQVPNITAQNNQIIYIGHSLGSQIGIHFISEYPTLVKHAVLSGGPFPNISEQKTILNQLVEVGLKIRPLYPVLLPIVNLVKKLVPNSQLVNFLPEKHTYNVLRCYADLFKTDWSCVLKKVTVPVTFVYGLKDTLVLNRVGIGSLAAVPHSVKRLHFYDHLGHILPNPEELHKLITN